MPINDTCGPLFTLSSPSASLQRSLANRLAERMDVNGSPEFVLTWKEQDMPSGVPICRLVASARRTSDNGCTGWRSPDHNQRGGCYSDPEKVLERMEAGHQVNLEDQAVLAGWPTPTTMVDNIAHTPERWAERAVACKARGVNLEKPLATVAMMAGWPTPMAGSPGTENYNAAGNNDSSRKTVELCGWPTPNVPLGGRVQSEEVTIAGKRADGTKAQIGLENVARLVGWNTPRATDGSNGGPNQAGGALPADAQLAGWPTPIAGEKDESPEAWEERRQAAKAKNQNLGDLHKPLGTVAQLAGWATPVANDDNKSVEAHLAMKKRMGERDGSNANRTAITSLQVQAQLASGPPTPSSPAGTEKRAGSLNPFFSLTLMGYSVNWGVAGLLAFRRLKQKPSSKQQPAGSLSQKASPTGSTSSKEQETPSSRRSPRSS